MVKESLFSVLSITKTIIYNENILNFVFLRKHQGKSQGSMSGLPKKILSTMFKLLNSKKTQNSFLNILDPIPS